MPLNELFVTIRKYTNYYWPEISCIPVRTVAVSGSAGLRDNRIRPCGSGSPEILESSLKINPGIALKEILGSHLNELFVTIRIRYTSYYWPEICCCIVVSLYVAAGGSATL